MMGDATVAAKSKDLPLLGAWISRHRQRAVKVAGQSRNRIARAVGRSETVANSCLSSEAFVDSCYFP